MASYSASVMSLLLFYFPIFSVASYFDVWSDNVKIIISPGNITLEGMFANFDACGNVSTVIGCYYVTSTAWLCTV